MSQPLQRVLLTPFTLTRQLVEGWAGYLSHAATRPTGPVEFWTDTGNFWSSMFDPTPPTFAHPHEVVREWPIARLLDFGADEPDRLPTLVLPPRSGMTSSGVDLSESAGLIGTLLASGHHRTHSLEWFPATGETASVGIIEHVEVVREAITELGGRVHLVGFSQGGWLAAIIAALDPDSVATLTLGAAPIDCHAGLDLPGRVTYRALGGISDLAGDLIGGRWIYPGMFQAGLLRTMEWTEDSARAAKLWAEIGSPELMAQNAAVRRWLNTPEDLPGPFVRWTVDELFAANKLIRGELSIGDEQVDLSRISCPLFLITGDKDVICPPAQLLAIEDVVSTRPELIHRADAPVGHLDLLFDRTVLAEQWAPLLRVASDLG
ncbi:alpha/beta fold hydrolase [Enemella sp. A6]|uniref:alpha/beta fold hydrolase n=1 Tax=Enemella sp. A6 TaxID=3440152 RepID=UPI003EC00D8C